MIDVRGELLEVLSIRDLYRWGAYLKARARPNQHFLRDADQIEAMAAHIYGG